MMNLYSAMMTTETAATTTSLFFSKNITTTSTTHSETTTRDLKSNLSSFEKFCGDSPFWDTDLLLDSSYPKFTECFQQVAVAWIPCLLFIVVCAPYIYNILQKPSVPTRIGVVGVAKTICSICLLGITIATIIVRATDDDREDIPDALYVSEGLKAACFILTLVLSVLERRKGIVTSLVCWIFWLILFILNIIPFYTNLEEDKKDNDEFGFIIFNFYAAFVLFAFIIASFVEPRQEEYQDLSNTDTKFPSPENKASIPSQLTFWWMKDLFVLGFKKPLEEKDIYDLNPEERCETLMPAFKRAWGKEKNRVDKYNSKIKVAKTPVHQNLQSDEPSEHSPLIAVSSQNYSEDESGNNEEKSHYKSVSVLKVLLAEHGLLLFTCLIAKAGFDCFTFLTPKITEALLDYTTYKDDYYKWRGYALAISYLVINSISSLASNQIILCIRRIAVRMKSTLINTIYRKSLTAASIGDDTPKGEVVNLMSVDCQRIEELARFINHIFSSPAQIAVALYLLYDQLGAAVFAGMGVMILTVPVNAVIGYFFEKWQCQQMELKDKRINLLTEILNGIKVLKLYAWEGSFQGKIEHIRKKELQLIIYINYIVAVLVYIFMALPSLIQVTAFGVHIADKGFLDPTVAFVSLQLFNMLNIPLVLLPLLIPNIIQTVVSLGRISNYLNKADIKSDVVQMDRNAVNAVEINSGDFTWNVDQPLPTLRNINMEVKPGSLVAVVGTVGCGKSSLISAILGEMEKLNGSVTLKGSIAYVPQEAWIQNDTLSDNILFGKRYHQPVYDTVIEACALRPDLEILPGGDKTEIGEKGINISGGQKQRVSLARAVYSDRDIYLMDDPLSAVDSHVGKHIFNEVLGENGLLKQKTRILVTHGIHWLPNVDKIFVLTHGIISESGTYTELLEKNGDFAQFLKEYAQETNDENDDEDEPSLNLDQPASLTDSIISEKSTESSKPPSLRRRQSSNMKTSSTHQSDFTVSKGEKKLSASAGVKLIEEETSLSGKVRLSTYLYYFGEIGKPTCLISIILYMMYIGCSVFSGIWLTEWTSDDYLLNRTNKDTSKYDDDTNRYLGIYAAASIGQGLFVAVFYFICAVKMTGAARNLHINMLGNVLRSPMSFFDTTPIGRLINRFSRDVDILDNTLPNTVKDSLNVVSMLVVNIVNICYGTPIFLVALLPLAVIYITVQTLYISTCRQLRRIDSVTRSPIYMHFSETLNGSNSIRAYRCQERFIKESVEKIDHNMKFFFASEAAFVWLSFWLQLLGNLVVFAAALFAVVETSLDPSVVGLSVAYASSMTMVLEELVNAVSETETNIVSVERIKEYTISPQEAAWTLDHYKPKPSWPDKGDITFDNYQTRYRTGLELVLKGITCTIHGGEKIGIVGRTGAGKSSMTLALFRIIEAAVGKIIIDGMEVSKMGLHDLRSKITILPQEPVLFSGTMRMNLDPFDIYSEPELWNALEHSYLKEFVDGLPGKLEYECGEDGSNLSVGQRQLVCLARTLLRKTKVLVLDEATAAVDMETDDLIQQTIRREFKECTILTIAHRLNTIIDYDRVMVLDQGSIKEFDSPEALLADDNSVFYSMAKNAGLV